MTEVNGARLAYRGLVAGLAGGWVWLAIALVGLAGLGIDPLRALRPTDEGPLWAAIGAIAIAQAVAGLIGLLFAYFFGRYFTVRATVALAAPAFALLAWLAFADLAGADRLRWTTQVVLVIASIAYGAMLGGALPVRGEVLRRG